MAHAENIPLPEEVTAEDESLYRRRRRAVAVRRSRLSSLAKMARRALVSVTILVLTGYVGYRVAILALFSSRFRFDPGENTVVEGIHNVSRQEVVTALGPSSDAGERQLSQPAANRESTSNLFRLSLDEKRRQVESLPWVLSATLTRAFPNRLVVWVVERTPVAFANVAGRVQLVDAEGVFLEKPEKVSFDFPIVTGLDSSSGAVSQAERRARLALYQEFTSQLAGELPKSGWLVSEVDLSDADDLKALLVQGRETIVVHFGRSSFAERFYRFLSLFAEVRKINSKIDSIDLRYRNQVVVNPATGSVMTSGE